MKKSNYNKISQSNPKEMFMEFHQLYHHYIEIEW